MRLFALSLVALVSVAAFAANPPVGLNTDQTGLNSDANMPSDAQAIDAARTTTPDAGTPAGAMEDAVRADHDQLDKANAQLDYDMNHHSTRGTLTNDRTAINAAKKQLELDQKACTAVVKAKDKASSDAQAVMNCM